MVLPTLVLLLLAIATHRSSRSFPDEAIRIVATLISRALLFLSLLVSPWVIKVILLLTLLSIPVYAYTHPHFARSIYGPDTD